MELCKKTKNKNKTKQNKIFKILKGLIAFTIKDQSQIAIMIWKNEIDMSPMWDTGHMNVTKQAKLIMTFVSVIYILNKSFSQLVSLISLQSPEMFLLEHKTNYRSVRYVWHWTLDCLIILFYFFMTLLSFTNFFQLLFLAIYFIDIGNINKFTISNTKCHICVKQHFLTLWNQIVTYITLLIMMIKKNHADCDAYIVRGNEKSIVH